MPNRNKVFLITGGAGFIGSALIRHLIEKTDHLVVNVDKLTYAGNLNALSSIEASPRYKFYQLDICNQSELQAIFETHQPDFVMHLAAESHVDRSINGASEFIQTNIVGTYTLLESARAYLSRCSAEKRKGFKFHHVSTDEVYGDLNSDDAAFTEETPYAPSSPYSASKASSDHLVRAWYRTYTLPIVISNCSNNYGPYQHKEKLIPLVITNAISGKKIPVYGNGEQIRDWLFVDDHVTALLKVCLYGTVGETYNIGGCNEKKNIEVVHHICKILNDIIPEEAKVVERYEDLIEFVSDRPGHDLRYAINIAKINCELDWLPVETFESGLKKTVLWYIDPLTKSV